MLSHSLVWNSTERKRRPQFLALRAGGRWTSAPTPVPPQPPFHPKDYPILLELLGSKEFERRVCPLNLACERLRERRESYGYAFHLEAEHPKKA